MPLIFTILLISMITTPARADLIKSTTDGFIVQHEVTIDRDKVNVFRAMTGKVGDWWSPDHSYSNDSGNMLIDEECFCERWSDNLVRHLDTTVWIEDSKVVMEGGLGPLKDLGLSGAMIWSLTANENGSTTVTWKHHVYGFSETGLTDLATAVDGVLKEQIDRFADYLN